MAAIPPSQRKWGTSVQICCALTPWMQAHLSFLQPWVWNAQCIFTGDINDLVAVEDYIDVNDPWAVAAIDPARRGKASHIRIPNPDHASHKTGT